MCAEQTTCHSIAEALGHDGSQTTPRTQNETCIAADDPRPRCHINLADSDGGRVVVRVPEGFSEVEGIHAKARERARDHLLRKSSARETEAWDSLLWLDAHAAEVGADLKHGFIVGGMSAGAINAAACTHHSLEEKRLQHAITGQYLSVPGTMDKHCVPEKYKSYYLGFFALLMYLCVLSRPVFGVFPARSQPFPQSGSDRDFVKHAEAASLIEVRFGPIIPNLGRIVLMNIFCQIWRFLETI